MSSVQLNVQTPLSFMEVFGQVLRHRVKVLCLTLLELLSCPELHSILRLVLKAGNYMNAVSHSFLNLLSFSEHFQSSVHFTPSI